MEVDEEYFGDHDDDNDGVSYEGDLQSEETYKGGIYLRIHLR